MVNNQQKKSMHPWHHTASKGYRWSNVDHWTHTLSWQYGWSHNLLGNGKRLDVLYLFREERLSPPRIRDNHPYEITTHHRGSVPWADVKGYKADWSRPTSRRGAASCCCRRKTPAALAAQSRTASATITDVRVNAAREWSSCGRESRVGRRRLLKSRKSHGV